MALRRNRAISLYSLADRRSFRPMALIPALFAVFGIGGNELLVILLLALLLFGGSKLPSLARGLGQSIKEFKKASKEDPEEDKVETKKAPDAGKTHGTN